MTPGGGWGGGGRLGRWQGASWAITPVTPSSTLLCCELTNGYTEHSYGTKILTKIKINHLSLLFRHFYCMPCHKLSNVQEQISGTINQNIHQSTFITELVFHVFRFKCCVICIWHPAICGKLLVLYDATADDKIVRLSSPHSAVLDCCTVEEKTETKRATNHLDSSHIFRWDLLISSKYHCCSFISSYLAPKPNLLILLFAPMCSSTTQLSTPE